MAFPSPTLSTPHLPLAHSPSLSSLTSHASVEHTGNRVPLQEIQPPNNRQGRGTLPGTPPIGPSSSAVFARANRDAARSAGGGRGTRLAKRTRTEDPDPERDDSVTTDPGDDRHGRRVKRARMDDSKPLVVSPDEDMQSKMMKFNMVMQLGQVAGQTEQSAESMDNSIVQESDAILQAVNVPTP